MSRHGQRRKAKLDKPRDADSPEALHRAYERRLQALEARLRGLIEVSSDFYWETDENHRFTLITGPLFEKMGVDPHRMIGRARWELRSAVPLEDNGSWEHYQSILDAHQPFTDFVYKFLALNGELRYASTNGQPVFDDSGRFCGYRGIGKDHTQRIRVARRIAMEQAVTRMLADATHAGDAAERVLRAVCEALGWACGARWVLDENTQTLKNTETWGIDAPGVREFLEATRELAPIPVGGEGLVRRTCELGEPQWIRNVTKEPSFLRAPQAATAGLRSAFAFPIRTGEKIIGAMEFYCRDSGHEADVELLRGAAQLGEIVGQFISRVRTEEELRNFRSIIDTAPDLIFFVDPETMRFLYWNEAINRTGGWAMEDLDKTSPSQASGIPEEELKRIYADVIARGGESDISEVMYIAKNGKAGWFETQRRAVRMGDKWIILSVSREISSRKLAERRVAWLTRMYAALGATNEAIMHCRSAEELYRQVCDAAVNGGEFHTAAVLLPEGSRLTVAAAVGAGTEELRAMNISIDDAHPDDNVLAGAAFRTRTPCVSNDVLNDERLQPWHERAAALGIRSAAAVPLMHAEHRIGVLQLYSTAKRAFSDNVVQLLERMARNIAFALDNFEHEAERKRAEERIQYLATHDALTGLPNRVMFNQLLATAIPTARRYERPFAVLFIDLDRFKVINDTLGHGAGDELLQQMSTRLRETLRESDTVARLGGDEFVVLLQEAPHADDAATVARKVLAAVTRPIVLAGHECRVTASIGIAMYPGDGDDEQSLMKNADIAMYYAKEEGKNNFQFHSENIKSQSLERLTLETNLRRALEREEFSLHYQAKLDLKTGVITGVEALLRWQNPELGSVSPAQFIPVAEEIGMIVPIGKWVLRTACAQNVAWQRQGLPPICMAVNLSVRQFNDESLLADIAAALDDSGMAPGLLELEITEGMVIHNPARALRVLTAIKGMGARLAVDDFGTGYSSLGQLKNFPIDTLKVDRSFIRDIPRDAEDQAITEAIIAMGKTLSLTVVAEGVETEAQVRFLRTHACDEMQGFYFSKPVAPEAFAQLLRNTNVQAPRGAAARRRAATAIQSREGHPDGLEN